MNLFGNKSIRAQVLEVIEARIVVAQEEYDMGCKRIDERAKEDKSALAVELVQGIVGKIL